MLWLAFSLLFHARAFGTEPTPPNLKQPPNATGSGDVAFAGLDALENPVIEKSLSDKTAAETEAKKNPNNKEAQQRAQQAKEQNQTVIEQQLKANPDNPSTLHSAGRSAAADGNYPQAHQYVDLAKTKVADDPKKLLPLYDTSARIYFAERDFAKAAAEANRALRINPKDPVANAILKLAQKHNLPAKPPELGDLGYPKSGMNALEMLAAPPAASRQNPADKTNQAPALRRESLRKAQEALGALMIGDPAKALRLANAAVRSDPSCPEAYRARAMAEKELARLRAAIADASRAISLWTVEKALSADQRQKLAATYALRARAAEILHENMENVLADFKEAARFDPIYLPELQARMNSSAQAKDSPAAALGRRGGMSRLESGSGSLWRIGAVIAALLAVYAFLRRRKAAKGESCD